MQLEVGKSYIRRDGKTAIVRYLIKDNVSYPWVVEHDGRDSLYSEKGELWIGCENQADLIRPADEPVPLVVEVGKTYEDNHGTKWKGVSTDADGNVVCATPDGRFRMTYHTNGVRPDAVTPNYNLVREVPSEPKECESHAFRLDGKCGNCGKDCDEFVAESRMKMGLEPASEPKVIADIRDANPVFREAISKPSPPTPQPWDSPEDVPMPCLLRSPTGERFQVTQCVPTGIWCGVNRVVSWHKVTAYQYSTDGREWKPCVKGRVV